jgi:Tfp pilus assembly protein PilN
VRPVNLIPREHRRREPRATGGVGAYAVIGVLALLLAMVAAYVLTTNKVTERQNDAAAASSEADRLQAQAARKTSYTDFAQVAVARTQAVSTVAKTRFDWERFMRELSLVMPEGSWLQTTDASVTGDLASAGGSTSTSSSTTSSATAGAPAANLVGCTPHQSDVARMMVRLREANRVTDVSLNESAQEQANQRPAPDTCGRFYKFDITVNFSATEPGTEAPRGERRVPAALGGGS